MRATDEAFSRAPNGVNDIGIAGDNIEVEMY